MSIQNHPAKTDNYDRAFSLVEIMLSLALIVLLVGITIVAVNPSKHIADSHDSEREADLHTIMQALYLFSVDNNGQFPSSVSTTTNEICRTGASDCSGLVDLSVLSANEAYLINLPLDPQCDSLPGACSGNGTGYSLRLTAGGRIKLMATSSDMTVITVTQ